jgi:hypothetical protein
MAGRKQSTFKKRQKEQQRKERREEKFAKRMSRKHGQPDDSPSDDGMSEVDAEAVEAGGQTAAHVEGSL